MSRFAAKKQAERKIFVFDVSFYCRKKAGRKSFYFAYNAAEKKQGENEIDSY